MMLKKKFNIHTSKIHCYLTLFLFFLSLYVIKSLTISFLFKWCLVLFIFIYIYTIFYSILLKKKNAILQIEYLKQNQWEIFHSYSSIKCTLSGQSVLTKWLTVLYFKPLNQNNSRTQIAVIFKDALPRGEYRQLTMLLKTAR